MGGLGWGSMGLFMKKPGNEAGSFQKSSPSLGFPLHLQVGRVQDKHRFRRHPMNKQNNERVIIWAAPRQEFVKDK
jgi:hypothetical protein